MFNFVGDIIYPFVAYINDCLEQNILTYHMFTTTSRFIISGISIGTYAVNQSVLMKIYQKFGNST